MKQRSVRGTFKGGFYKGNKKTKLVLSSGAITYSNDPEALGLACALKECWHCPRKKTNCGCKCHL